MRAAVKAYPAWKAAVTLLIDCSGSMRDLPILTAAVNDSGYLERHLRQAIEAIESRSPVELLAIGIDHNVGAYYSRSLTVTGPENLGEALVLQLIPLLQGRGGRRSAASERGGP